MVSLVRSRPNHYEVLGLDPAASAEKIAEAFAKRMSVAGAQPMGVAAQICAAFQTLRDPAKRRDYDRSIGLGPKPQPQARQWTVAAAQPRWAPVVASPAAKPKVEPAPPRPEAAVEPRTSSFIAASLRELARPMATEAAVEAKPVRPEEPATFAIEPEIRQLLAERTVLDESVSDEERAFDWRRPALALSGLVIAAGLIGTMAGIWVRGPDAQAQAEPAVTVSVPAAKPHLAAAAAAAVPVAEKAETSPRIAVPTGRTRHRIAPQQVADVRPVENAPADNAFVESATEQVASEAAPASPTVAADLPLPNKLIARTIERIGYACGAVSSATAVEGAAGVFKVTCTSGQVYRAAPVGGRYRFKRWSGE